MSKAIDHVPTLADDYSRKLLESLQHRFTYASSNALQDGKLFKEWLTNRRKWKYPVVSFDTFLDSSEYLGVGKTIYPEIRRIGRDMLENKYSEGVFVGGIGSGKTTVAELLACYETHVLLCMRDPFDVYNLTKDKPITLMNMGTSATQALENCFEGIKNLMKGSPWFMRFRPRILTESIRFMNQNILLSSGNSKSTTPLGYNIFYAVLDEAAFYLDNDNRQIAEEIYTALQRRIVSRFGHDGMIMMISSPRYEGDFIMRKLEEAKKFPDLIYSEQLPTWKCKPLKIADVDNKFYFNSRRNQIETGVPDNQDIICKLADPFDKTKEIWEIPGEYKKSFIQDPHKAKRDFAALPSMTIEAFMPHLDLIDNMFIDESYPVQDDGSYKFDEMPLRVNYYIHVDLALNKKGKGDKAGLAMAHFDGWEEDELTKERTKKVKVDLAEQIKAGPTGEIRFEDVRNKIYGLKAMGFNIKLVTLDQFQSADTIQILRSKGIKAEYLSVDRTIEPYQTLKETIYSGRIKCHKSEFLRSELQRLEITKSNKIDHPPGGSKDVSDAVCGAVYSVISNTTGEIGMSNATYSGGPPPPQAAVSEKEKYYRELQQLQEEGII